MSPTLGETDPLGALMGTLDNQIRSDAWRAAAPSPWQVDCSFLQPCSAVDRYRVLGNVRL